MPSSSASLGARETALDPTLDYHMNACSGAETRHILGGTDQPGNYGELPQLAQGYLDANTTLVTISIGGNDMRFAQVLKACIMGSLTPCPDATMSGDTKPLRDAEQDILQNQLGQSITDVLNAIRAKAPNAKILLMGYPRLFDNGGSCIVGMGDAEWPWINTVSDQVRDKLSATAASAAAAGMAVKFVDPQPQFAGRTVCSSTHAIQQLVFDLTPGDQPMMTIPKPGTNIDVGVSAQSIHPNPDGTTLYAQAMNNALAGFYK